MLRIPDLKQPIEVESPFDFPLDPFQKYAIKAISNDENVLVTAKTGSGKTLVGEFQIHHSLKKGKRVFYTTPIKSLSNQKFHDLKKMFPSVGIMTGDIKFMPQADVVIMTTEILRNLLFKQGTETENVGITANLSLKDLDAIVFDEVHYINDFDRGKVWEECLTLVNPNINLVLLSATIEKPEKFAEWLGESKQKPIHLISTEYRVVPLVHQLPNKTVILDSNNTFNKKGYSDWFNKFYEDEKKHQQHKERVFLREPGQVIKQDEKSTSFVDRMNKLIKSLDLPALFFVFSRKVCVSLAKSVSSNLIDSSDSASVRHIVKFHLHKYPYLETSTQYHELLTLLEKGVAYHHSGLLPILKEIVEILFSKGFIKVLFATETFAVGINMPTKVVVFTSYRKYDDKSDRHRMLTTSEYTQMAGRAGRRGKDDKGIVVYLPMRDPEPVFLVEEMMTGKQSSVTSRMDFHYSFVLSELNSNKKIQKETYWAFQRDEQIKQLEQEIEREEKRLVEMDQYTVQELLVKQTLETNFHKSSNAQKKKWQIELSKWNNSHTAKTWDIALKQLNQNNLIKNKIEGIKQEIITTRLDFDADIRARKDVLEETGYLLNGLLTQKGLLASEIHEGHNLLMSHAFTEKLLHNKEADDIIVALSVFLEDVQTDEAIEKISFHEKLKEVAKQIYDVEQIKSEYSYWTLTSYWAEVVWEWVQGNDFVCEKFGVDHGNFVRAILKLSNILEEWMNLATMCQDVEMVEKLKDSSKKLLRGFVIPDSLYLRI